MEFLSLTQKLYRYQDGCAECQDAPYILCDIFSACINKAAAGLNYNNENRARSDVRFASDTEHMLL